MRKSQVRKGRFIESFCLFYGFIFLFRRGLGVSSLKRSSFHGRPQLKPPHVVFGYDAMAGDENRQWIRRTGQTDRTRRLRMSYSGGDFTVGADLSVRDFAQCFPDLFLKIGSVRWFEGGKRFPERPEKGNLGSRMFRRDGGEWTFRRSFQMRKNATDNLIAIKQQRDGSPGCLKSDGSHFLRA